MGCHPARWVWGLIPIAMLSWIAVHTQADRIERDLELRSRTALDSAGYSWASVAFSGRDGLLVGEPSSSGEVSQAVAVVDHLWGVRYVREQTRQNDIAKVAQSASTVRAAIKAAARKARETAPQHPPGDAERSVAIVPSAPAENRSRVAEPTLAPPAADATAKSGAPPANTTAKPAPAAPSAKVNTNPAPAAPTVDAPAKPASLPTIATAKPAPIAPSTNGTAKPSAAPKAKTVTSTATLTAAEGGRRQSCDAAVRDIAATGPLQFRRGAASLNRRKRTILDKLAGLSATCPDLKLQISGHADARGNTQRNQSLSERRARVVVGYLITKGIDAGRLKAVGYGDTRPLVPNDNAHNRAKNRRIEFEVTGVHSVTGE